MEVLAALGLGAKELFNYNRENFKFDQDQRIEREALRLEMQVKRFELFREDVRDLVELTVDRMDVYHLVGALFLEFCIVLFCEGRVQANAPPFLLSLFLLSNACAFIYLLLAVWLSMHASIASHSFGVRLLTRFVRLPIPGIKQITALRSQLQHFERQGVANLLRLPFQDRQEWKQVNDDEPPKTEPAMPADLLGLGEEAPPPAPLKKNRSSSYLSPPGGAADLNLPSNSPRNPRSFDPSPTPIGRPSWGSSASSPAHGGSSECDLPASEHPLLPEEDEGPFGGEELLASHKGARPERHVQLFRQLQSKWQCYDAYCRVCMGLGVNQILQGLSYYCICHTLVENQSPTTGYALVVLFQCTTVALAVLDLAGLKRHEIIAVQVVGMFPCVLTAWGVAHGRRDANGELDPRQRYILSPLSFLAQVLWLELWLRVAAPSGADQVKLPRRFRQVLFLDVFGDAVGWDGSKGVQDINGQNPGAELQGAINQLGGEEDEKDESEEEVAVALRQASSQLTLAECAVRRWRAAPSWALSGSQCKELEKLREQLHTWGNTITTEAERRSGIHADGTGRSAGYSESHVQKWSELTEEEKRADPFATCLVGPFEHDMGYKISCYHFDVETQQTLFEDDVSKHCPGALVLTLEAVSAIMQDLVKEARALLEVRITADLRSAIRRQQQVAAATKASVPVQEGRRKSKDRVTKCTSSFLQVDLRAAAVPEKFPNLFSLFRPKGAPLAGSRQGKKKCDDEAELLANPTDSEGSLHNRSVSAPAVTRRPASLPAAGSHDNVFTGALQDSAASPTAPAGEPRRGRASRDPVLVAMAGQHAQHFVPERLPWQVLSRMTRVLQVCWLWSGTMAFLKEVGIYQVDFQNHPGGERRLCVVEDMPLEAVPVRWPHGDFFHPQGVFFLSADTIAVGSPFAFYVANATPPEELQFEEVARTSLPPSTFLACLPTSAPAELTSGLGAGQGRPGPWPAGPPCLFIAPSERQLEVWPLGEDSDSGNTAALLLESRPWRLASGAVVPCKRVLALLPPQSRGLASWCLLLAGWDGELLPIAAVPLTEGPGHLSHLRSRVRPCLDAPLSAADAGLGVAALHLEPATCRLWAVLGNGELLAWDLLRSKELGRWRFSGRHADGAGLRALAATTDQHAFFYVLGRKASGGPLLLRGQLPAVGDDAQGVI